MHQYLIQCTNIRNVYIGLRKEMFCIDFNANEALPFELHFLFELQKLVLVVLYADTSGEAVGEVI